MLKNQFTIYLLSTLLLSTSATAATALAQQGFTGPTQGINTVISALNAADDTPVVLTGHITASTGDETYQFVDKTGTISVEIDRDKWFGLSTTPETKIIIYGEVEKDFASPQIVEVKRIQLAH